MSKFLYYNAALVSAGRTLASFKDELKTQIVSAGWSVIEELASELSVRPPAYEALGGALGYPVIRIIFNASSISFATAMVTNVETLKSFSLSSGGTPSSTATYVQFGASTANRVSFTIPTVASGDIQNSQARAQATYDALIASSNAEAQKYNYEIRYLPNKISNSLTYNRYYVHATAKNATNGALTISSGSNINTIQLSETITPGSILKDSQMSQGTSMTTYVSIVTPYPSGFVYYLSMSSRSIFFCTKSSVGLEGPLYGVFINRATAVSQTPPNCTPIELYIGRLSYNSGHNYVTTTSVNYLHGSSHDYLKPSHIWGTRANAQYETGRANNAIDNIRSLFNDRSVDTMSPVEDLIGNLSEAAQTVYFSPYAQTYSSTSYTAAVLPSSMSFNFSSLYVFNKLVGAQSNRVYISGMVGGGELEDLLVAATITADESLHLISNSEVSTSLTSAISAVATTIDVSDTSAFPAAGTLRIGAEVITYSAKTATQFQNCIRGREGTAASNYTAGELAYRQLWVVVINKMAIPAGYVKPS